jgi:hypothetical protein
VLPVSIRVDVASVDFQKEVVMNSLNGGVLVFSKSELGTCYLCGCTYPIMRGDKILTCEDWVEKTISRMPTTVTFELFVSLKLFAKLCKISGDIRRGLEVLDDVEGGG